MERMVSVLFESGGGIIDTLIKLVTVSRFSHCFSLRKDGFGVEALLTGVVARKPRGNLTLVTVPIKNSYAYESFLNKAVGKGYDFTGVLSFIMPFLRPSAKRWYCSELVMEALIAGGVDRSVFGNKKRISPKQLHAALIEYKKVAYNDSKNSASQ